MALHPRSCPARGEIGIFNRSHYEEVLVVRVHPENLERQHLPAEARGQGRLEAPLPRDQRLGAHLSANGVQVVKLFLNLSREEQRKRLLARIDLPEELEVLRRRRWRARATGTTTSTPISEVLSAHQHRVGARGM